MSKKYIEIINLCEKYSENIHPLNNSKIYLNYSSKIEDIFKNDLGMELEKISNYYHFNYDDDNFYLFFETVDDGGSSTNKSHYSSLNGIGKKKISLKFDNKNFSNFIKNNIIPICINFYVPFKNDLKLDFDNMVYIIINPFKIERSTVYKNIKENKTKKLNPSSSWVYLKTIIELIKSSQNFLEFKTNKKKDSKLLTTGWVVKRNYLHNFIKEFLDNNYFDNNKIILEEDSNLNLLEKETLINSRIGMGKYRKEIIELYNAECLLSGINFEKILIASHILPWKWSNNLEKINKFNGLLLSANIDKLFDSFLISFDSNGLLVWNEKIISKELLIKIQIKLEFIEREISIFHFVNKETQDFLIKHYEQFLIKRKNNILN